MKHFLLDQWFLKFPEELIKTQLTALTLNVSDLLCLGGHLRIGIFYHFFKEITFF